MTRWNANHPGSYDGHISKRRPTRLGDGMLGAPTECVQQEGGKQPSGSQSVANEIPCPVAPHLLPLQTASFKYEISISATCVRRFIAARTISRVQ
jgi:hypothetical protein